MSDQTANPDAQLSGQVLFYRKPEPLSVEAHGALGVKRIDSPFRFLADAHAVPLTVTEFGRTAVSFPIVFVGPEKSPIAVMGVNAGVNLYVDDNGQPEQDQYLPAFVRRYPFVFASDDSAERLMLCIDREAPMVSEAPDIPFFENGEPSKFTQDAIEFCKEFERQRRATSDFINMMNTMGLFEEKSVTFQGRDAAGNPAGEPQKIADYFAITEEKLATLSDEQTLELRRNGALGAIYAHMISLLNWERVINRALRRSQAAQA